MTALLAHSSRRVLALTAALVLVALSGYANIRPAFAAPTSSAKTLKASAYDRDAASAPFPDLEITVSQTEDLIQQGITVSWSGGKFSDAPQGNVGGANFLQLAQCWGDEPGSNGTRPDRRTCQYGGTGGWGATRDGNTLPESIADQDKQYSPDLGGYNYTGIPFVAYNTGGIVDEKLAPADKVLTNTTTNAAGDVVLKPSLVRFDNNQYFTSLTTNEVKWAPSGKDGTGSTPFELQTASQSPGLGCGTALTGTGGTRVGKSCWLVVIPRGEADNGSSLINTPGVWWDSWKHHLAVKLDFKPLGVSCQLGSVERHLSGSELAAEAVASWQPVVCKDGSPYTLAQISESDALQTAAGTAPSALALASRPLDLTTAGVASDPLVYAPIALGGISISFAIDAFPSSTSDYKARSGLPLSRMKLTPRLLAKLLTSSYIDSLPGGANLSHLGYKSFSNPGKNARTLVYDPDFRAINDPEWAAQLIVGASMADVLMPLGRSDLAQRVWEYVMADPEAKAWLNGEADPWGMIVNPCYSTNAAVSAKCPTTDAGAAPTEPLTLPRDNFPKADRSEKADTTVSDPANGTGVINLVTWRPYTSGFVDGGYRVLRGDGMTLGAWDRFSVPPKYGKDQRQLLGSRRVVGLTTTPAASTYQTATAVLRNPAGQFVSATPASLQAAAEAMTATTEQKQVLRFDPASTQAKGAKAAYPLTIPVYAALNPTQTDAAMRADYAKLITYAVGAGQTPGTDDGTLPAGYAPIPDAWKAQATTAAANIKAGVPPSASAATTASATTAATTTATTEAPTAASTAAAQGAPEPAQPTTAPATDPAAKGATAPTLTSGKTGDDPGVGAMAAVVPVSAAAALVAALAIPPLTRRRRL